MFASEDEVGMRVSCFLDFSVHSVTFPPDWPHLVRRCLCLHGELRERESGPRSPETSSHIFRAPTLACLVCCGGGISVSVTPHTSTSLQFGFFIGTQYLSSYFQKLNIVHNRRSRISNTKKS